MRKIRIEEKEKRFYGWLVRNRYRVALITLSALILFNASRLPYLNLIFNKDTSLLILIVAGILIFNVRVYNIFKTGIILLGLAFIFQVMKKTATAELLANCIFAAFVVGTMKSLIQFKDKESAFHDNREK